MIGQGYLSELVTLLSLQLTFSLVSQGLVAKTFTVTNATATTPVVLTVPNHGVASQLRVHGVVSGVGGIPGANGLYILTPLDANTFSLTTFSSSGAIVNSVGTGGYTSGGTIQCAFPEYGILLGRRHIAGAAAQATPRVVFVPTFENGSDFEPYGGIGQVAPFQPGSTEIQNAMVEPQYETQFTTFEVYVTGSATDLGYSATSPDFYDFDATQAVWRALRVVMINSVGAPRCKVLRAGWPSQLPAGHPQATGVQTQRGAQYMAVVQFQQPVTDSPMSIVTPTQFDFTVSTVPGGASDDVTFNVT